MRTDRTYGWSLSPFGSLVQGQLLGDEAPSEIGRTLDGYAAAIGHTGMRLYGRELAELRTVLQQRTR